MAKAHKPSTPLIVLLAALGAACAAAFAIATQGGWSDDAASAAARLTARYSFWWFAAAWSASALARLFPGGWRSQLLFRRRAVGLGFAAAHGVHFCAVVAVLLGAGYEANIVTLIGGGVGYVFVAAMALTSNDAAVRALGLPRWKLLHATGGYVLAFIFAFTYLGQFAHKPFVAGAALAAVGAAALLRAAAWVKTRRGASHGQAPARTP